MVPFLEIKCKTSSDASLNGKSAIINIGHIAYIKPNTWNAEGIISYTDKTLLPTELTIVMSDKVTWFTVEKEMAFWVLLKVGFMRIEGVNIAKLGYTP